MLIAGNELNKKQRAEVLGAFIYRWTIENSQADRLYKNICAPTIPKISDEQWLRTHAFLFVKDGSRLNARYKYCKTLL